MLVVFFFLSLHLDRIRNEAITHLRDKTGQQAATSETEWLPFIYICYLCITTTN